MSVFIRGCSHQHIVSQALSVCCNLSCSCESTLFIKPKPWAQVRPCAAALAALHGRAAGATLLAVYKKYSASKFHAVAKMAAPLPLLEGEA